ncbi:MAG: CDP-alcohol phosphatidyltransferase family protein [Spirochaetales bacterium]|nr:CDP-alcohol phosphatidyltransferase family protein [Spirochaetales bacterium]
MKAKISSFFSGVKKLYFKSVKPFYTEELAGTFIFRPVGFLVALLSKSLKISPNMLSIIRGILGIWGGVLFFMGTVESIFYGAMVLIVSQVFDFADGQLARLTDKTTRFGVVLDGIGDGISLVAVYLGTAFALFKQNPQTGAYWWILTGIAALSLLIHIYTQGFLRYEFFLYSTKDKTKFLPEDLEEKRVTLDDLRKKIKAEKKIHTKILITFMMFLNLCHILASNIVLIKKYRGYFNFHKNNHDIPEEKMALFGRNYKNYNGWILLLLNNVGFISNQLIFIIAGFFNRLDLTFYIILIGSNLYFLLCVIIQRISFKIQVNKINF